MMRFVVAMCVLVCAPLLSQQHAPRLKSFDDRMTEWKAEHHIILNVTVQDASGTSIAHLTQHDITLLDNGKPQPLPSFREMEGLHPLEPVHVILVLDTLNNSQRELGVQRKELELFLKASGGTLPYPTSLTVVTDAVTSVGDVTRDATSLSAELTSLPLTSHMEETDVDTSAFGRDNSVELATMKKAQGDDAVRNRRLANLNRRFQRSIPALEYLARAQQDSAGRCLILWLGRGWPMLTESEFTSDSARTQLGYFDSIVTLTNTLRESQSTVYSLSSPRVSPIGDSYKAFLGDVTSEYQAKAANLSLQVLAIHSGGDVLDRGTLSDEIRSTMAGADSYYSVAFDAQPARTPHEHHALHLTVAGHPNAVIHTDSGYYNEP